MRQNVLGKNHFNSIQKLRFAKFDTQQAAQLLRRLEWRGQNQPFGRHLLPLFVQKSFFSLGFGRGTEGVGFHAFGRAFYEKYGAGKNRCEGAAAQEKND